MTWISTAVGLRFVKMLAVGMLGAVLVDASFGGAAETVDYTNYVEIPEVEWELAPGQGAEIVETNCTACHSLAPILQHRGFTREQWAAEIHKMQKRYGAPIDGQDIGPMLDYLAANYGKEITWDAKN